MSIPKGSLDSPSVLTLIGTALALVSRWVDIQEGYLELARQRFQYNQTIDVEHYPDRVRQQDRHMDIQEQRLEIQKAKIIAEHGNWPGIDLENDD